MFVGDDTIFKFDEEYESIFLDDNPSPPVFQVIPMVSIHAIRQLYYTPAKATININHKHHNNGKVQQQQQQQHQQQQQRVMKRIIGFDVDPNACFENDTKNKKNDPGGRHR